MIVTAHLGPHGPAALSCFQNKKTFSVASLKSSGKIARYSPSRSVVPWERSANNVTEEEL